MGYLYILVIMQYLFKSWCIFFFFLIFTCLHLDLWFSHVNSTIPVTIAALYIVCFQSKGNSSWEKKKKKKGQISPVMNTN